MRDRIPAATVTQANQGLQYGAVIDDTGQILLHDEALSRMVQAGAGWVKLNFRLGGFANNGHSFAVEFNSPLRR